VSNFRSPEGNSTRVANTCGVRFRPKKRSSTPPFAGVPQPDEVEERHAPEIERVLLRHGVLRMSAGRCACSRCGRSPLVGERMRIFAARRGTERALCDLCLTETEAAGKPLRMEQVRAGERPLAILRAA
jgi:hypothetical protein